MGIFSGFNKKKKIEPVILSVELLISMFLKQNLDRQIGSSLSLETELVNFENFQINFLQKPGGFVLKYFTGSFSAPVMIFIPDDFISKYVSQQNSKDPELELFNIFSLIPEYLLLAIKKGMTSAEGAEEKPDSLNYIGSTLKSTDEFLWNISSYKIIQINTGSLPCFLFIEEKKFLIFNKYCREYEISSESLNEYKYDNFSPMQFCNEVKITGSQAEFLFGRFFLPRTVPLGAHIAVSGFTSVLVKPELKSNKDGVIFVLNLTIDDNVYTVYYLIPSKKESRAALSGMIQTIVKSILPLWRKYFVIQKVAGSIVIPSPVQFECLLSGEIKYKNNLIPVEVSLSEGLIKLFYSGMIEPGSNISADLSRVIQLNQYFLLRFFKENLFFPLSLSEFLNLIDEIDLRRVIQNFFSGTGWKGDVIQRMFNYSIKDIPKKKIYYFQDALFNRDYFFKYLPKSKKDEWLQSRSVSESSAEMSSLGRNALKEIYHAYQNDHLELSFKGATLLINEFKVHGDKIIRKELDRLIENEPFSSLLEDTFPRDVQNLLAKLTAKLLANALVLYPGNIETFKPFISRNFYTEVKELIKIIQRKSIIIGFDMEDIKTDLLVLHNNLKTLIKEDISPGE